MTIDLNFIIDIMNKMSKKRKYFHSEGDLTSSFSRVLSNNFSDLLIRNERRITDKEQGNYYFLDIFIKDKQNSERIGIEFKYIKQFYKNKGVLDIEGEIYNCSGGTKKLDYMLDFWKDVERLESFKNRLKEIDRGYAIFFTNDNCYWNPNSYDEDRNFRLAENEIEGNTEIGDPSKSYIIEGKYILDANAWKDYSNLENYIENREKNKKFLSVRYLILEI